MVAAPLYFPWDVEKTEEAAAVFLDWLGGRSTKLFLIKLLYLADRRSLAVHGVPICGGHYYSLPHGPVISEPLDLMNGRSWTPSGGYIGLAGNTVTLSGPTDRRSLSQDDLAVLTEIFAEHGQKSLGDILQFVESLPEHHDPAGSRLPILTSEILRAQSVEDGRVQMIAANAAEVQHYRDLLGA